MKKFNQKGEGDLIVLIFFAVIVLAVIGGIDLIRNLIGGESEGMVKYDDCREIITVKENSWERYFHKYTCMYRKTMSGKIMSGECVSVKTDSPLLSSSHACVKAYVYEKKQSDICTNPQYPYLGYDDKCYTVPQ